MATKSVAEWAAKLEDATGVVSSPMPADPSVLAPASRLLWLRQQLTGLGIASDFLDAAEGFRERASALRLEAMQASQQAAQRRERAVGTLGRDNPSSLAEAVEQWQLQAPWLDSQPDGQGPPALQIAETAARLIEGQIATQIFGHGERIFALAQKKATELVQEIADLPQFPKQIGEVPIRARIWRGFRRIGQRGV